MWWNEALPETIRSAAKAAGVAVDDGAIHLSSDLDESGAFGKRWLVITREQILCLTNNGEILRRLPVSEVKKLEACNYVGGGLLRAEMDAQKVPLVRYSTARGRVFGLIARGFEQYRKEGRIGAGEEHAPKKCPHCGRNLGPDESVCPLCISRTKVLHRIWEYAREYKGRLAIIAAVLLIGSASSVIPFKLQQLLFDNVLKERATHPAWLLPLVLLFAAAAIVHAGMMVVMRLQMIYIGQNVTYRLRGELFRHVINMGLPFFDKYRAGELMSRIDSDSNRLEHLITQVAQLIFQDTFLVVALAVMMFIINWRLALIALVPLPLVVFTTMKMWPWAGRTWHRMRQSQARLSATLNTSLSGVRVVKAFGQEDREERRFDNRSGDFRDMGILIGRSFAIIFSFMGITMQIGGWLIWYLGGKQVLEHLMSLGELVAFAAMLGVFYGPFSRLVDISRWATESLAAAQRIFDILDTDPDQAEQGAQTRRPSIEGRVRFENVTFGYEPLKPVLKNVSLEVQPGEMIGLVGHSGVGKTTTTNLVLRFYTVNEGTLYIDDADIRTIATQDMRRQMAVVPQEPYLFAGSVGENIAYGRNEITPEEIIAAAMAANAHDFVMDMPDAYDSAVGEQGQRMSAGERQRLTVARALACNPRILILDEATSSVDTDTERQIQEALARLVKGRTTIAIAHRLSTLKNAHRLVVLKDGRVEEMGTHEELMKKGGEYKRLVDLQSELSRITVVGG